MARHAFDETVRLRAYGIWLSEGRPDGRAFDHWVEALGQTVETFLGAGERDDAVFLAQPWLIGDPGGDEVGRLRHALWQPQPYRATA